MAERFHFTVQRVQALPAAPAGKRAYYYDNKAPGLQVVVTEQGTKTFYLYRKVQGKPERFKLGRFPDLSPEGARRAAYRELGNLANGRHPKAEKRAARAKAICYVARPQRNLLQDPWHESPGPR